MFLGKNIDLIHPIDPIQYDFWFWFTTFADPEPGAEAETSLYRLQLRLHNTANK
jgi:hypothetical protein